MSESRKTLVHLLSGPPGPDRARRLAEMINGLPESESVVLMLEGMPEDGSPETALEFEYPSHVLAPGCPCCVGQLTLRVTLARILQHEAPRHLFIGLIDPGHIASLCHLLEAPPWRDRLTLEGESGPRGEA